MNKKMLALVLAALMSVSTTVVAFAEPVADSVVSSTESDETVAPEEDGAITNAEELKKAVQKSGTVKLGAKITASIEIPANAEVTLDLNGYTLTNEAGSHTITNKGTLTIIDSSDEKNGVVDNVSHAKAAVWNEGTADLKGGEFTRSKENGQDEENAGGNSYYVLVNHNNMNIYNGVVVSQNGHFSSMIENGWYNGSENTGKKDSVMTIYGGDFTGGLNTVKNDDYGVLTIHDGIFNNVTQSAVLNWNEATIEGGEFYSSGENGDPVILNGAIKNSTTDKGQLTIKGGQFRSDNPKAKSIGKIGSGSEITQISGGVFYSPVAEEGYQNVEISDQAAQVTVKNDSETTYRFGNSATNFEVAEGDTITIVANPKNSKFELAGDEKVTVVNKTDKPVEVNDTTIEAGKSADVNADGEVEERVERDNGGDYFGNERWGKVKREIAAAEEGDTIKVSATGLPWFPSSVARALKGHDITLEIRKNGTTYSVNGEKIGAIEKIWYEFDQLEEKLLTAEAK